MLLDDCGRQKRVYKRGKTWDFMVGQNLSAAEIKAAVEEKFRWSTDEMVY
jgi:hypothetical protein